MTDYWFTRTVDQLTSDPLLKAPSGKTNGKPADNFQKILERSSGDAKPEAKPGSESEGKAVRPKRISVLGCFQITCISLFHAMTKQAHINNFFLVHLLTSLYSMYMSDIPENAR